MRFIFLLPLAVVFSLLTACSVPGAAPELTGNEAFVELRSSLGSHTNRPLSLKLVSIDGVSEKGWGGFGQKRYPLAPGRRTLRVAGEFENQVTTVTFTLNAQPRQTYWIAGQFDLQRGGYLKHSYTLQDSRGKVLARRTVVP